MYNFREIGFNKCQSGGSYHTSRGIGVTSRNDVVDSRLGPFPNNNFATPPTKVSGIFLMVRMPLLNGFTMVSIFVQHEIEDLFLATRCLFDE